MSRITAMSVPGLNITLDAPSRHQSAGDEERCEKAACTALGIADYLYGGI